MLIQDVVYGTRDVASPRLFPLSVSTTYRKESFTSILSPIASPKGSVVARQAERLEEVIVAEQGGLTDEEKALMELLKKKLRRELEKAA